MGDMETIESRRPKTLGRYTILGELGHGGMGVVYRAHDPKLRREIAIKVLPADSAAKPDRLRRFKREAEILAALNHPNIATIHDLDEADGRPFIAQELIEGPTLADRVTSDSLPLDETLRLCREIAVALEAAHKKGVVHRDLKPANVKITPDGLVKVLDFGIAKVVDVETPVSTASGVVLGTPGYMSPEQLEGKAIDHRADIWAFGCVLFECIAGTLPFHGKNAIEVMFASLSREPDWDALPEETPESIKALLRGCLTRSPDARPEHMVAVRRVVDEAIARLSMPAHVTRPTESGESPRHNLPAQLTSFIGRTEEKAAIVKLLDEHRLVTLTGAGGCGKSRLALEVAGEVLNRFSDGVWLVELARLTDGGLVPQIVATALGVKEEPKRPLTETLAAYLRERSALLVMDNCEHLLDAIANLVDALLRASTSVRFLATTREALRTPGETRYRVPSLPVPSALTLDEAEKSESVRLFVERARASQHDFILTEENVRAVAAVCQHLDGIPFAIELAGARTDVMTVDQIAQRLSQRFHLLTGGDRTALPRARTLRACIDWSYEQLCEKQQRLLRCQSVFAGGWTLEAAEAVCADDRIEEWEVLDLLSQLVEKSLAGC